MNKHYKLVKKTLKNINAEIRSGYKMKKTNQNINDLQVKGVSKCA
jgi:hypothetical protein